MTNKKTDDLSNALDKINCGQTPECADRENSDLLEVALMLRKADLPARPPEHMLSAAVQRAIEGQSAAKSSHRSVWIYSGVLGAAAALLIFVGIHGFPSIQDVSSIVAPTSRVAPNSSSNTVKTGVTLPMQAERPDLPPPPTSAATTASPDSVSAPAAQREPEPGSQSVAPPARTPAASPAARQVPSAASALKSSVPPAPPPANSPAQAAVLTALRLPGRIPESVVKDPANGILRQVFDSGTTRELIVTQRIKPQAESDSSLQSRQQFIHEADKGKSEAGKDFNKVVVLFNGQEVSLEGRQTIQELAELAQTLK